jgi:hypothetical protein
MSISQHKSSLRPDPYTTLAWSIEYLKNEAVNLGLDSVEDALESALQVLKQSLGRS